MHKETVSYRQGSTELLGYLVYDPKVKTRRPAVIIAHAWRGLDQFAKNKAEQLANLGYVAFCADMYGDGKVVTTNDESLAMMHPLFMDRALLQSRIKAAYDVVSALELVDKSNIGGIGFCFGGLTIIELFRSGVDLKGVVSFHAVLGAEMAGMHAKTVPLAKNIKGSILILHGHDDPLVSSSDIKAIQDELTEAHIDWQMHIYGGTSHAFTVPQANDKTLGLIFNPKANERSWQSMVNFFTEVFT
ncbi:MAG: dienelactone hydrolase family protein [Verrucomicrobia bacterium]|nr:dienelactone hydrolase family protein [Verrucomicrobiota bacterium]